MFPYVDAAYLVYILAPLTADQVLVVPNGSYDDACRDDAQTHLEPARQH